MDDFERHWPSFALLPLQDPLLINQEPRLKKLISQSQIIYGKVALVILLPNRSLVVSLMFRLLIYLEILYPFQPLFFWANASIFILFIRGYDIQATWFS